MALLVVNTLLGLAGIYLLAGLGFAAYFITRAVGRLDPAAAHGTLGFRLIIVPGVTALWPLFLYRLAAKRPSPPEEQNAHRAAARSPNS